MRPGCGFLFARDAFRTTTRPPPCAAFPNPTQEGSSWRTSTTPLSAFDAQRCIFKSLEKTLKPFDITPGQWNLINQLDRAGALSQKELAELTRKEQATITRYLDTLERKGLVVRSKHQTDRRTHSISITDQARELIRTVQPVTLDAANHLIDGVEQEDLDTFVAVLERLKDNAENFYDAED